MDIPVIEPVLLRVEKGAPDPVELGALAAVLFRRLSAIGPDVRSAPVSALWRRPERSTGFVGPRSWQDGPR